jgi:hypothetical protein
MAARFTSLVSTLLAAYLAFAANLGLVTLVHPGRCPGV